MSNRNPKYAGISKYWVKGEDDRHALMKATQFSQDCTDMFLRGLWRVLSSRRRTKFVGFGVFEWRPFRRRLPTGRMIETWRLAFKPSRYAKKYKGKAKRR